MTWAREIKSAIFDIVHVLIMWEYVTYYIHTNAPFNVCCIQVVHTLKLSHFNLAALKLTEAKPPGTWYIWDESVTKGHTQCCMGEKHKYYQILNVEKKVLSQPF